MVATLVHLIYGLVGWELLGRSIPLWAAVLLSQAIDFDFGIGLLKRNIYIHRRFFHNIFSFSILVAISSYFFGFLASFVLLGTHIILDLFDSEGIPLFYPFSKKNYVIKSIGTVRTLPTKLYWDGTWWFYGVAAVIYLVFLAAKYLF